MKTVLTQKHYMNQLFQNPRICTSLSDTITLMGAIRQNLLLQYRVKLDHTLTPIFMVDALHSNQQIK